MMITLSRLYSDYASAERVVNELKAAGLPDDDIGVITRTSSQRMHNAGTGNSGDVIDRDGDGTDDRAETAEKGAGVGAALGGAAGLLAGLGVFALPGIGPVVAAGWISSALAGAVTGGAAGGVIGALIEAGHSENEAGLYADGVSRGGTLVTVRVSGKDRAFYEEVLDRPRQHGPKTARNWRSYDPAGMPVVLRDLNG